MSTLTLHVPEVIPPHLLSAETWKRLDQLFAELDGLGRVDARSRRTYLHRPSLERYLHAHLPGGLADEMLADLASLPEQVLAGDEQPGLAAVRWSTLLARIGPFDPIPDLTYGRLGLSESSTGADLRAALERRFPGMPGAIFDGDRLRQLQAAIVGGDAAQPRTTAGEFIRCVKRHLGLLAAIVVIALIVPILALVLAAPAGAAALFAALGIAINVIGVLVGCLLDPNLG